jgi:ribonuclease-3
MVDLATFARRAGLPIGNSGLLLRAVTHRSYVNEHPDAVEDNERLEFLGDAALDFVTAAWLYNRFPEMDEGDLTRLRAALVRTEQLAEFAKQIGLGEVLRLGRGLEESGGRQQPTLLCDAFEALMGALYLDRGVHAVMKFLEPRLDRAIESILREERYLDPRSQLQIWSQAEYGVIPQYRTIDAYGPDHARRFVVEVRVGKRRLKGVGEGNSKQEAARNAATDLLRKVGVADGTSSANQGRGT